MQRVADFIFLGSKVTEDGDCSWEVKRHLLLGRKAVINLCCCSVAQLFLSLCNPMNRSTPGLPVHHQLLESTQPMSIESVMPSNHLIFCCPLLLLPSVLPRIKVFSNGSALHTKWPKFSISPSNEYSELISFRMDWLGLLIVQGTLKSLLQYHSSKASILWCSAFPIVQPYPWLDGPLLAK